MEYVINCDWFSFSVLLPLDEGELLAGHAYLRCPDGYQLLEYSGTNIYRRRVLVFDDGGNKLLTLLLEPFSKVLKPNSMFVEVANPCLYRGFSWVLDFLESIHLFTFQSLSRFDVCCDFNPNVQQLAVLDGLQDTSMYVAGKREGSMFYDYVLPTAGGMQKRVARCLSWGSKSSNIKWKLYNKSLEVYEYDGSGRRWCNKPYIEKCWLDAGLDCNCVWRLEVSIVSAAGYQWRDGKIGWEMHNPEYYIPFFWDIYKFRFVVRANQGHKCRKWDTIVPFLEIPPDISAVRLRPLDPTGRVQPSVDHVATLRTCMQQLERPETMASRVFTEIWLKTAEEIIYNAHLEGYFYRTYDKTFDTYRDEVMSM